jgi:hypothetical protein
MLSGASFFATGFCVLPICIGSAARRKNVPAEGERFARLSM